MLPIQVRGLHRNSFRCHWGGQNCTETQFAATLRGWMALKLVSAPTQPWFRTFSGRWAALRSAPPGRSPLRAPRHLPAPVSPDEAARSPRVLLERAARSSLPKNPSRLALSGLWALRGTGCVAGPACTSAPSYRSCMQTPPSLGATGGPSAVGRTAPAGSRRSDHELLVRVERASGAPVSSCATPPAGLRVLKTVLSVLEQLEQTWYTDSQREGDAEEST